MLPGLGGGELSENLCPGVRHLSILLDAVNVVLFSIFHLKKYVYLNNFRYIYKKIFLIIILGGSRSITSLSHNIFLHAFASRHRDQFARGGKTISASFEEFKGKDAFFVREWLS